MNLLDLVYLGVAAATSPWWVRKARGGWGQRFAIDPPTMGAKTPGTPRILLHAVSVGEASALRSLVPLLVEAGVEVVVSCTTDTGLARAQSLYADRANVVRYPLDASWSVRRFLDAINPDAVGLVELELWPNFLKQCGQRGIPVAVINGRLSERSFRGYRRIAQWMRPSFAALAHAAVQDEAYAERFIAMGTPADRVEVAGSMKFDSTEISDRVEGQDELAESLGIDPQLPMVVGGSTGPGEEALLHDACAQVSERLGQRVQLLCAPRRPERFDEAAAALSGCVRRSQAGSSSGGSESSGRFLLDTIGELAMAYGLADVVVVGRSFPQPGAKALGGSDPIEPIALGRATVFGPDDANFRDAVRGFESIGALARANGTVELVHSIERLLRDPAERALMAERGRAWIRERQGASIRHRDILLGLAVGEGLVAGTG